MSVAFVAELPGMTTEIYDRVMENLNFSSDKPEGLISHYASKTPDGLFIFDVWEKEQDWQRFADERLGAAMAAATGGQAPPMEPRFYPIYREDHR